MRSRRRRLVHPPRSAFVGLRFPPEVITVAVRWYLRLGLSYRDVEELLAERGITVDHVTIHRWVLRFAPLFADAVRPRRHAVGDRWQVDETYVKVGGAADQFGQIIDVFVSARRVQDTARRFFDRAFSNSQARPVEVVTDRAAVYPRVLTSCCLRPVTLPIGMPTTGSRPTTASSRRGCGRCAG